MPCRYERAGTSIVHAHMHLCVFPNGEEFVRGHRPNADAVRRQQAPRLAAQELPLPALQIQPVNTNAVGVRVRGHEDVGGIVTIEVKFQVASDVVGAKLSVRLNVEAGILAGGTILSEMSLYRVAE